MPSSSGDPCKCRETGRIIFATPESVRIVFDKAFYIRYLEVIGRYARTGVPGATCRGRDRVIRGQSGWAPLLDPKPPLVGSQLNENEPISRCRAGLRSCRPTARTS